jgi:hypothetical protein
MRQLLKLHAQSRCPAEVEIAVEVTRPCARGLTFSYVLTGSLGELNIPPATTPSRKDELWRHTCFEAFIRAAGVEYYEFNFAPTTHWAAYRFSGYRSGREPAEIQAPVIAVQSDASRCILEASLRLDSLAPLSDQASWHLGLSAVIEMRNGGISYWALVHPSEAPDFHHPESFAYELSATVQA